MQRGNLKLARLAGHAFSAMLWLIVAAAIAACVVGICELLLTVLPKV